MLKKEEYNICFVNIETTGLNFKTDDIIEIYISKTDSNLNMLETYYSRFNTDIVISKEAYNVHSIDNTILINEPYFSEKIKEVYEFIKDCNIAGYNIINFALPFLMEHFNKNKILYNPFLVKILDTYQIWNTLESRDFSGAISRFTEDTLKEHNIEKNNIHNIKILNGQRKYFNEHCNIDILYEDYKKNEKEYYVDFSKKIAKKDNKYVLTFGKYKDIDLKEVFDTDLSYIQWVIKSSDTKPDTILLLKKLYTHFKKIKDGK